MAATDRLALGSISTGTTLGRDIASALILSLESIHLNDDDSKKVQAARAELEALDALDADGVADEILWELTDLAQDYAPDNATVGMHDGDGADFGVWPCEE